MNVGLIGVGLMGHGIARNVLARGGHALTFLDHPGNQPTEEIVALGGIAVGEPAEIAESCDVILLCVTGAPQVAAVMEGLLPALRPGTVIVDCSTSLPETTLTMGARTAEAGGAYLDAPMTRTAAHAHAGTLNLLVGGEAETLERVRPVLESFTESVAHVGPLGHGHRLKLLHNYVSVGFMTLLAEAAAQSADAGVDPAVLVEVLANGGGASAALDRLSPYILNGDRSALPFAIANAGKDIDYYREMAGAAGAQRTVADGVSAAIRSVSDGETGQAYVPEMVRLFRRTAEA
ncbi:2-hydroxy-3-oxopropionate reductase [Roseivivax halodurans JCM 10272]|uniref:2-hydroxy-3-oxopropionate reductase n=1 Tax=Roseivivax halodurans JCM 10272 TaxID=1449350 RepID=X7EEK4_9RHOB|nr:NAD(P)-dependent oxidoreductase [Roseivivax halodurans]ETX14347.1 2-hydroxy-3-oxopropionate reductase [Roseivivax halodurans JCM 10272]